MYKVSDKNVNGLFNAIASEDNELVAAYIKDIYVELFDNTQYLDGDELDTFTAQVDVSSDEGVEGINAELDKLYDFCDNHGINLPVEDNTVVNETLADSQLDKLLDKAFSYGYSYGYSGDEAFNDFLSRVKVPLEDEEEDRLRAAFDNGNRQAEHDEERSYYGESCNKSGSDMEESLVEKELSTKNRSISKIFVDNKDKINSTSSKEELVSLVKDLLKDVNPERTEKIFRALNSKRDYFKALQYIYDFILKGDDLGVIKEDVETEDDIVVDVFDDFNFDDDIDELIKETRVDECDCGFVPDDTDNIELVDVEEDIERPKEVVHVDECTPDRFKPANPVDLCGCKAHNLGPGDVDMEVDGFIPDDTDNIELK